MEEFFHQLTNGLAVGGIYALIALGYTMVYGVLRLINFAHGDLFTLGSYLGLTLLFSLGLQGKMSGILVGGALIDARRENSPRRGMITQKKPVLHIWK